MNNNQSVNLAMSQTNVRNYGFYCDWSNRIIKFYVCSHNWYIFKSNAKSYTDEIVTRLNDVFEQKYGCIKSNLS